MKTKILIASALVLAYILGACTAAFPAIVGLLADRQMDEYQRKNCALKGIDRDHCEFGMYFYDWESDHPLVYELDSYFTPNQEQLYYVLSRRCTNDVFHNHSAVGDKSGKITMREYFQCSRFQTDASDLLFGEKGRP